MGKLEQITRSVESLKGDDFEAFAEWFEQLRAERWDRQIEEDAEAGKLDKLAEEALAEFEFGRTKPL